MTYAIFDIKAQVCAHYGLQLSDMVSDKRAFRISHPRQVAMYLCRALTDRSYPQIARHFGYRHHTTILSGVRVVEADPQRLADAELIRCRLEASPRCWDKFRAQIEAARAIADSVCGQSDFLNDAP